MLAVIANCSNQARKLGIVSQHGLAVADELRGGPGIQQQVHPWQHPAGAEVQRTQGPHAKGPGGHKLAHQVTSNVAQVARPWRGDKGTA